MMMKVMEFLKKTYELVDDPSTDSIISWAPNGCSFVIRKPLESCSTNLPTRHLELVNDLSFAMFQFYGFKKTVMSCGEELVFECNDFVRGKPELLEKIAERYTAWMKRHKEMNWGGVHERLNKATTREEQVLILKERRESYERERKERMEKWAAREDEAQYRRICQDYMAQRNECSERIKKATSTEEFDLARKEWKEIADKLNEVRKERRKKTMAKLQSSVAQQRLEDQVQNLRI